MKIRLEEDVLGTVEVPAEHLWKSQTQRSLNNFKIGTEKMPWSLIEAFALLKKACAKANVQCGVITEEQGYWIEQACQAILNGTLKDEFPLSVWQTGSGTQTNMNLNEVIAQYGNQESGKDILLPNDTVNASQSSNDTFPAALHIMCLRQVHQKLLPALDKIIAELKRLEEENKDIIKIGRTHLQDATPLKFSQEISGWRSMMEHSKAHLLSADEWLEELAIGATAVGSGINCPDGFAKAAIEALNQETGLTFRQDSNLFHALTSKDACVMLSGALKGLAANAMKMANDVRWLASGPRCGIGEIEIPANEPGSSIMPGKVNPTQCEALTMVAVQVMGNDAAVGFAASQGNFELNVFMPVIAYNLDQSIVLLADALDSFREHCLSGLKPAKQMEAYVQESLMLVTCLNPVIGYKKAAKAARKAHEEGLSLTEALTALGYLTEEECRKYLDPAKMIKEAD